MKKSIIFILIFCVILLSVSAFYLKRTGEGLNDYAYDFTISEYASLSNITFENNCNEGQILKWDGGAGKCGEDLQGVGISFAYENRTQDKINVSQNTDYVQLNNFTITLPSTGIVEVECVLFVSADLAATGVQLQVNNTGSAASPEGGINSNNLTSVEYYTSATAQALCSGIGQSLTCAGASSGGPQNTIRTPTRIYHYSKRETSGLFTIGLKSETSASGVQIHPGSYCRSIERNSN